MGLFDGLGGPLTAAGGVVGLGVSLLGTFEAQGYENKIASDQSSIAAISANTAGLQQQINAQKYQQMTLNTQRSQMQQVRNMQRARANANSAAASEGAQYGSGLGGGYGNIAGGTGVNQLGLSQNFQIGQNVFGLDNSISQNTIQTANLQGNIATNQGQASFWQGIGSAGGSFAGAAGNFGKAFG